MWPNSEQVWHLTGMKKLRRSWETEKLREKVPEESTNLICVWDREQSQRKCCDCSGLLARQKKSNFWLCCCWCLWIWLHFFVLFSLTNWLKNCVKLLENCLKLLQICFNLLKFVSNLLKICLEFASFYLNLLENWVNCSRKLSQICFYLLEIASNSLKLLENWVKFASQLRLIA